MTRGGADTELGEVNMGGLATGETDYWFDNDGEASRRYVIERPLFISDDWRDHDEDDIYADWTVDLGTGAINVNRRYMEGVSFADVPLPQDGPAYFHGDHLGTTRRLSQAGGSPPARASIYTAFGELKYTAGSLTTRYGYVGASGYEESAAGGPPDLEFVHVGARWYDPSTGRFLQRDPIGIEGGLNVYAYVDANPLIRVDPDGELWYFQVAGRALILGAQRLFWRCARWLPVTFSGEAVRRMKERGLTLTVVENAVHYGMWARGKSIDTAV